jgi:predicted ferric reductase
MTSIQELIEVSETNPGFRMFPFCSDKYGKISIKFIGEMSSELKNREIYLCGPPAMMQSLRQQFKDIGINNKFIHSEEFQFL